MPKKRSRRDYYRREHRTLAHYLMIQCWMEGSGELELDREDLRQLLETDRLGSERLDWLAEDFEPWFQVERLRGDGVGSPSGMANHSDGESSVGLRLIQPAPPKLGSGERLKPIIETRAADSEARIQHLLAMASGLGLPKQRKTVATRRSASKSRSRSRG